MTEDHQTQLDQALERFEKAHKEAIAALIAALREIKGDEHNGK
jgi:hypothetical protein